ncbi:amidase family protein [Pseudomonas amygdali]|uniref:amidase family protein n=1 Tax=Pseudomonas amygdali TaxID=47877 RepID=UPI0006B8DF9E|nr:amidase family protein [Pseudomonas amygdali]KPB57341.1 Amidase family protein [Pseudomonas amygdali pv. myricae]KWS48149.1 amidase [Pseudomonas amygdali pv. myricae]RMU97946.1 Amidase protein [Pseudomonas amygdali pv. myricae]RMV28421.1 Amidase protein [Pseudomonas amygdali pv. myricae]
MKNQFGFCLALSIALFAFASQTPANFDGPVFGSIIENKAVYFESGVELQRRMSAGNLTSVGLVTDLLQRIEVLNKNGPALNAVIEINPDALQIAAQMDGERSRGEKRGPLHGIPILVKDNLDTGDQMQTTAGALSMVGLPAPRDAFVVQRLRDAGAIIIGKANLSEWAPFRGYEVPSGWSSRGGQTRHPYDLSADPLGSSSGSAVGLAAGFSPLAIGTETNGSIIQPAATSGVIGLRPTLGLLSRTGMIPLSSRQDTPGPMARTVTDTAILLTAMSGNDPLDEATARASTDVVNYVDHLRTDALSGKRLGYPNHTHEGMPMDDDPEFQKVKSRLSAAGAILVPVDVPSIDSTSEFLVLLRDFKRELNAYLSTRTGLGVSTLDEIIAFNTAFPGAQAYDQDLLIDSSSVSVDQEDYLSIATSLRAAHRQLIDGLLQQHSLDVLIDWSEVSFKAVGAIAGYPGITVPVGLEENGLPRGLYFLSTAWDEGALLSYAYALEQALATSAASVHSGISQAD